MTQFNPPPEPKESFVYGENQDLAEVRSMYQRIVKNLKARVPASIDSYNKVLDTFTLPVDSGTKTHRS